MKTIIIALLVLFVVGLTAIGCKQNEQQKQSTTSASQGNVSAQSASSQVSDSDLILDQGNTEDTSDFPEPSSDTNY